MGEKSDSPTGWIGSGEVYMYLRNMSNSSVYSSGRNVDDLEIRWSHSSVSIVETRIACSNDI